MQLYCRYCDDETPGDLCGDSGSIACSTCGRVIMEDNLVEDVQFSKGPGGQSRMQGAFVKSWSNEIVSSERSLIRGRDQISMLITSLKMGINDADSVEIMANTFYERAARRYFTRRYKIDYVAAACLYLACRTQEKPYLLIDFSEKLAVNVYVIGAVYLHLCHFLYLDDYPAVQKPVDPSLFIHRFTRALVEKLENDSMSKDKRSNTINKTAMSIIASMKRDWMQTGRKPSGLCGAAIYVAALSEGIRFPKSEVINVVHICEATLTKRLIEFENTESGSLTITEFEKRADYFKEEQHYGCANKSDRTKVLCMHEVEEIYAHGLCKECHDIFIEVSGGLERDAADPPSFQRSEIEEVLVNKINEPRSGPSRQEYTIGKKGQEKSGNEDDNITMATAAKSTDPHFNFNSKETENLANDDPDCLSDIDDKELNCYLNNEEEVHLKKIIWEQMNKEYLEEQALKEAAKAESFTNVESMTDEMREAQKLAAAASEAVALARKQKKEQKILDAKNAVPPRTAAEAAAAVLNNKGDRRINLVALQKLFNEDDVEPVSKKMRKEEVDASDDKEEAGNVNNYYVVVEDYQQVQEEDYEPDPNSTNEHNTGNYYDGHDEPTDPSDQHYDGNDYVTDYAGDDEY